MKQLIAIILSSTIIFSSSHLYADDLKQKIHSKGAVLIEQDSKRVLFEKNAYATMPMASTTKIMTCIVALEKGHLEDIVTVSQRAARAPAVKLHLKPNEKQRLGDLLYSLMLESHNDTAVAIAEHIGGSVEEFCNMMTMKAKEIGAQNTCFKTPNGLDAAEHYTTAYDLALIGAYALSNPKLVKIITTTSINIPTQKLEGSKSHGLQNKNRFIYSYKGATGMKTGFTNKAGHCFVGSANQEGMQLIGVALAAGWGNKGKNQKYRDVMTLMDYGFHHYKKYDVIVPQKDYASIAVKKGVPDTLTLECSEKVTLPLSKEEKQNVVLKKVIPTSINAPVEKGEIVGRVEILYESNTLAQASLKAQNDVRKATVIDYIKKWFKMK
ncbi:D-alanyl-D-alanine carboxypeptidase family protein [Cellulosilyticum sp. I15G10I2]|uniref:D-alanyl-D-alanine carboxypeptidase family protein n=1 Tax=Cellulosilyticum sp. I15G10I2 TaxID=1892843 RepID=UPI00085C9493|nr:D-alanyl-D-alanine carboxypeptidase family protein [Cellulosilyticum sp. I15G10I2]